MTQANNRQGQGGGELVPFIEGGAAPRLDRVARWGGTESNRARAARGGSFGGYLDGRKIAGGPSDRVEVGDGAADHEREAKIHALALDVARTTICTYADARAHVEAMFAPRMERLDAAQVREVFERVGGVYHADRADATARQVVAIGLDGERIAVPVDPNAMAAPMAQAVATALGSRREAEGNAVRPREQPAPAPGHVWLPPPGAVNGYTFDPTPLLADADGTLTVGCVDPLTPASVVWCGSGADGETRETTLEDVTAARGWTCIGVATPNGRVMVGDGFVLSDGHRVSIIEVAHHGVVECAHSGGGPARWDADDLAREATRTRYAPARAGERYASRMTPGAVVTVSLSSRGEIQIGDEHGGCVHTQGHRLDPAQWERLDAGTAATQTLASDLSAHEIIMDWIVSAEGIGHANGGVFTDCGRDGLTAIGLTGGGRDLRALFDAIGRALELPATRHACPFGAGLNVTVLRDEMLFTPTAETGIGSLFLSGDTRALCALRSTVGEAMATGRASLPQWGAKGPRVEVVREGGAMVAPVEAEPCEAPRYTPASGGADAWRWGVGE